MGNCDINCDTCCYSGYGHRYNECFRSSAECTYKPISQTIDSPDKPKQYIPVINEKCEMTNEAVIYSKEIKTLLNDIYNKGVSFGFSQEGIIYLVMSELYGIHLNNMLKKKKIEML